MFLLIEILKITGPISVSTVARHLIGYLIYEHVLMPIDNFIPYTMVSLTAQLYIYSDNIPYVYIYRLISKIPQTNHQEWCIQQTSSNYTQIPKDNNT